MIPSVGVTCLFTFTTPFASLTGVYTLLKTMTFETALASAVSFTTSLYTPAGLTASQYATDAPTYAGQIVLQIQGVGSNKSTILFVPVGVLAQVPDPTVSQYPDVYLSIHIGPFAHETVYTWIAGQINDLVSAVTGNLDTAQFYSNPADDVYLTQGEYATLAASRAANVRTLQPLLVQNRALQATISALQAKLAAYEQTLIDLYTQQGLIQTNLATATSTLGALSSSATAT